MVNEVNKLIYNAIIKHQALYIPGVGTISVMRRPASMKSKKEVLPPRFDVEFSTQNRAKSLIDIISMDVDVDAKRAEEIYTRWLDKVQEGSELKIDRVGTIRGKSFDVDKSLITTLNINSESLHISRKGSYAPTIIAITLILLGAICGGGWWYISREPSVEPVKAVVEEIVTTTLELPSVVEHEDVVVEEVDEIEIVEDDVIVDWRIADEIHHWLVVGSYSTTENAERAIADIEKRMPSMQCDYFKLGTMYAVAVYGSVNIAECQEFKKRYSKEFAQSWIYTPKKFR